MKELLKNYLENREGFQYKNVEILDHNYENALNETTFTYDDNGQKRKIIMDISVWDVLAFVNNKLTK